MKMMYLNREQKLEWGLVKERPSDKKEVISPEAKRKLKRDRAKYRERRTRSALAAQKKASLANSEPSRGKEPCLSNKPYENASSK